MPVPEPIVATVISLLAQVPGVVASVKMTEVPLQIVVGPFMDVGSAFTVKLVVAIQPVGKR